MTRYCYLNNKIIPLQQAVLPVTDISILRGYAVFDFAKTYNGQLFLLKEHCARLRNSAKKTGLTVPVSDAEIETIIKKLLVKNKMKDANIRIVLTGGETIDGLVFNTHNPSFFILTEDIKNLPKELYSKGAKLITHEHQRAFFESKTTNYITAVSLQKEKNKQKAIEILYTFKGRVLECTTSNFFIIKNKKIITPNENILFGITRNFVITLARKAGYTIEERTIKIAELAQADEAFITATNKEIVPIIYIDNLKIGTGKVGPITQYLMDLFFQKINKLT